MKQYYLYFIFVTASNFLQAQLVSCNLSWLANKEIRTESFKGIQSNAVESVQTDDKGNFSLPYHQSDYGVGYLISADKKSFFIILNGEDVTFSGESSRELQSIAITNGQENLLFEQYAQENRVREQALSAGIYLEKIYIGNTLLSSNQKTTQSITKEKARLKTEDATFLNNLPRNSCVSWYLPTRKLLSSASTIAKYRTQEIPAKIAAFKALDYTDKRLYKSGLFKDAIASQMF
jgi:hypothetical protein